GWAKARSRSRSPSFCGRFADVRGNENSATSSRHLFLAFPGGLAEQHLGCAQRSNEQRSTIGPRQEHVSQGVRRWPSMGGGRRGFEGRVRELRRGGRSGGDEGQGDEPVSWVRLRDLRRQQP